VEGFLRKESQMPLIKPRTRGKQIVRHIAKLYRENNETLYAYAEFLGEPTEYVLNQLIESKLAKDKEFVQWREQHPESYVPRPSRSSTDAKRSKPAAGRFRATPAPVERISAPAGGQV
jgi:hypothetical protein